MKKKIAKYNKDYYHKNIDKCRNTNRKCRHKRYNEIKQETFKILGNKCCNPFNLPHPDWCNDPRCLQIDHVNGNGAKERKTINSNNLPLYILKAIKSGSKDYQLLCANCNWIKRHINNEFPQSLNTSS